MIAPIDIGRSSHSAIFRIFWAAILERQQLTFTYKGLDREVCPHILGHKEGEEKALVYQFAGESSGKLPARGQWKCLYVAEAKNIRPRKGKWHTGDRHMSRQRCIDAVFVDVNTSVPNQPGRQ